MSYGLTVVTPATVEPLTREDLYPWLRIDEGDDSQDGVLDSLIVAAREYAEKWLGAQLCSATLKAAFDWFPEGGVIELPSPPLQSVTSVKYTDTDAAETTLASTEYDVDTTTKPGRLILAYGSTWPTSVLIPGGLAVTYVAGFASAGVIPESIKQAMRLLIGFDFRNREATKAEMDRVHSLLALNWDGSYR